MHTQTDTEIRSDVKDSEIEPAVIHADFDKALEALIEKDYEIISLAQNARSRIREGRDSYISRNPNWTREGVIHFPGKKSRLVPNSPILLWGDRAMEAHRNDDEFYPTRWQVEQALEGSIELPQNDIEIPTDRFGSEALTTYLFGGEEEAKNYGEFLKNEGIDKMPILTLSEKYVNSQSWPFVRQVFFLSLDAKSGIGSCDKLLSLYKGIKGIGLRGIKTNAE